MQSNTMTRRGFLTVAAGACAMAVAPGAALAAQSEAFPLPPLPYAQGALDPVISERTVSFHYGKHTAGYYKRMNAALTKKTFVPKKLEEVVTSAHKADHSLFNNAAQAWNHTFYWNQFTAGRRGFGGKAGDAIKAAFGSYDDFKNAMLAAAGGQFGSGWAWLVEYKGVLMATKTPNAENPLVQDQKPLLVVDVWEHAYYLDYQNRRKDHVAAVLDKLVDWDVVAARMG